jgi:hypothetical protein
MPDIRLTVKKTKQRFEITSAQSGVYKLMFAGIFISIALFLIEIFVLDTGNRLLALTVPVLFLILTLYMSSLRIRNNRPKIFEWKENILYMNDESIQPGTFLKIIRVNKGKQAHSYLYLVKEKNKKCIFFSADEPQATQHAKELSYFSKLKLEQHSAKLSPLW